MHYLTLYVNEILEFINTTSPSTNSKIANFVRKHIKRLWLLVYDEAECKISIYTTLEMNQVSLIASLWNRKYQQNQIDDLLKVKSCPNCVNRTSFIIKLVYLLSFFLLNIFYRCNNYYYLSILCYFLLSINPD